MGLETPAYRLQGQYTGVVQVTWDPDPMVQKSDFIPLCHGTENSPHTSSYAHSELGIHTNKAVVQQCGNIS